jgi:hypothetical protein
MAALHRIAITVFTALTPLVVRASPAPVNFSEEPIRLSDYKIEFGLLPDTVIPYEKLWFKVAVTNVSGRTVPNPDLVSGDGLYSISFVDDKGAPASIPVWEGYGAAAVSSGSLEPGESHVHFEDLGDQVWNPLRRLDSSLVGRAFRLVVTLNPKAFVDEPGRDSALAPRYLPFWTVCAQGEEIGATVQFLRAYAAPMKKGLPSPEPLWRELIERYPDSRLVEEALGQLHFLAEQGLSSGKPPLKAVRAVIKETVERRPESPLLAIMISKLGRGPGFTTADYDGLMHEIAARRPDSPALEALKARR